MTAPSAGKEMAKLLSFHLSLDSAHLCSLPQKAIHHDVSKIAKTVHDPLFEETKPQYGGKDHKCSLASWWTVRCSNQSSLSLL